METQCPCRSSDKDTSGRPGLLIWRAGGFPPRVDAQPARTFHHDTSAWLLSSGTVLPPCTDGPCTLPQVMGAGGGTLQEQTGLSREKCTSQGKDGRIKSGHDEGGLGMRAVPHTLRMRGLDPVPLSAAARRKAGGWMAGSSPAMTRLGERGEGKDGRITSGHDGVMRCGDAACIPSPSCAGLTRVSFWVAPVTSSPAKHLPRCHWSSCLGRNDGAGGAFLSLVASRWSLRWQGRRRVVVRIMESFSPRS